MVFDPVVDGWEIVKICCGEVSVENIFRALAGAVVTNMIAKWS
jgi:hypothetical protein